MNRSHDAGRIARAIALLLPLLMASSAWADERVSLELTDSTRVEGNLVGRTAEGFVIKCEGTLLRTVPFAQVRHFQAAERPQTLEKRHANVLTFDLFQLMARESISLRYERRLHERLSLGAVAEVDYASGETSFPHERPWGVGGFAHLFAAGGFERGLYLGIESLFAETKGTYWSARTRTFTFYGEEILAGGVVGYRRIFPFGIVVDGSLGFGRDVGSYKKWVTLAHLAVGGAL